MRLILINQFFPPDDAPTGVLLSHVAVELQQAGHDVTVFCSEAGYTRPDAASSGMKEILEGVRIVRLRGPGGGRRDKLSKMIAYLVFYLHLSWSLLTVQPRPDRIVALTTPPFLSVLTRLVATLRRCGHAHWVMDLYPDVIFSHGMLRPSSWSGRLLSMLARWGMAGNRCESVITIGPDMACSVSAYVSKDTPLSWVPLWSTSRDVGDVEPQPLAAREGKRLKIMYSGNMGLGHRFGEVLSASVRWGQQIEWHITGEGSRRREIEEHVAAHPELPIHLGSYVDAARLRAHLQSADVHLVSLEPKWDGTMVPSKLQGIFAAGRPVIFIGSRKNALASWLSESGAGWIVEPDDHQAMDAALKEAQNREVCDSKGRAALNFADSHFNRSINQARVAALMVSDSHSFLQANQA
jgi:glycosyltransferase involved in cell wall biosynthesis